MGKIKNPVPVKVFCGLIYKNEEIILKAEEMMKKKWGEIDFQSCTIPFDFTDYYSKEMGENLIRKFISFSKIIVPEKLWEWKIFTNKIEKKFSENGKRKVNIDPGYLDLSKIVLLSTKDFYHRVYLGNRIYAEVTMYFSKGKYQFFQWTYPDYKTESYIKFFKNIRELYSKQLKNENAN